MPVLFTLARNNSASEKLFGKFIRKTIGDDKGVIFFSKDSCTSHDSWIGEYSFCGAIKLDEAESEIKLKKNQLSSRKNQLSSTESLLCILIEDLGCAIELHEEFADDVTERHSLDPRKDLFNGQEGDDCNYFLFGQGIINDFNRSADKEYLKLYESWFLFAYREFYKNLLAILDELSLRTYGEKTNIRNRFCKDFGLHNDEKYMHI
jgi:hypothetical protein